MKESFRKKMLAEYPEWHNYPLRLTIQEIKKPLTVIKSFYSCYDLPAIRACLKEWLEDALSDPEVQAKEHLFTYHEVERLVEAVYILHRKPVKKKKKENVLKKLKRFSG